MFGAISAKFRTFAMQIYFAIPPNSAFHGLLEEFLFTYQRHEISNTLAINLLGNYLHFPTAPKYLPYVSFDVDRFIAELINRIRHWEKATR